MNKEIQVLYTIFELELSPPIELEERLGLYNRYFEFIGWFDLTYEEVRFDKHKDGQILRKIKQVFNVDKLSDKDIYNIAKHLINWLENKFPYYVKTVRIYNEDTKTNVYYHKQI